MNNNKSDTISRLQADWKVIKGLFDLVPRDDQEKPGMLDEWSAKDLMGHVTTWQEVSLDRVLRLRDGGEIVRTYSDINVFNAEESAKKKGLSLQEVERQFMEIHNRLIAALEDLPEHFFLEKAKSNQPVSPLSFKHYREHAEDLRRWLKSHNIAIPEAL